MLVAHLASVTLKPVHVTLIQPMLAPLFLQLGSVVAFAFGFAPVVRWRDVSRRSSRGPSSSMSRPRRVATCRGRAAVERMFRAQSPKSKALISIGFWR